MCIGNDDTGTSDLSEILQNGKDKHIRAESLQELEWEQWLLKIRSWLLEHGQKLTMQGISVYGKEKTVPSSVITYVRKAYRFTEAKEERDEIEKDIWTLENLDIAYKRIRLKMCRL